MLKKMIFVIFLFSASLFVYAGDNSEQPLNRTQYSRCNVWRAFQYLLARGANVHPCEYVRSTIMYGFNRTLIAFRLVDVTQQSTLRLAILRDDIAMVHALIATGANLDLSSEILEYTAARGHTAVVHALLAAGANSDLSSSLHAAAAHGHIEIVHALLAAGVNSDLSSSLHAAAAGGYAEVVGILIAARASPDPSPDMTVKPYIWTPLMHASMQNNTAIVKMLINARARIDNLCAHGDTALIYAARYGHAETVKLLLAAGANPHIMNRKGETALMLAAQRIDGDVVSQMVIDEYHRRLRRPCPIAGELIVRDSHTLMERMLPIECGQEVASLLSEQDILALRLVSTHCLLYAQHEFEKIKNQRTVKLKKNLIEDIKSAISTPKIWSKNELLEPELIKAESFNVATALIAHVQQPINVEIARELSEINQPSSQELRARRIPALDKNNSENSGAGVGWKNNLK